MADVTETVVLPNQPTVGSVKYVPLGGDGYTAPHAAYEIRNFQITGDDQLGKAQLTLDMDQRFCCLVSYAVGQIAQGTAADADFRFSLGGSLEQGVITKTAATLSTVTIGRTWRPPPVLQEGGSNAPQLRMVYENVDADVYFLTSLIYLFNIRAREVGPLGYLLWSQGAS